MIKRESLQGGKDLERLKEKLQRKEKECEELKRQMADCEWDYEKGVKEMIFLREEFCPHCEANLQGDPIPEKLQQVYGYTHYTLKVGITDIKNDSIINWKCPFCEGEWPTRRYKRK